MSLQKHLIPITEEKQPIEFADTQLKIFWLPDEVKVDKDVQDILINMSESEKHGVITTLKLFSLYETHAGSEFWGNRYRDMFDGSEFHRMASVFSMFELAVHGPFYNKINELLHLNDTSFYLSYLDNPVLKDRIEFIGNAIDDPDDLVALGTFSMVEGVILYSSFAYLKHFQSQGKNKLLNIVRGINFSLRDENIHALASAWSYKYKLAKDNVSAERRAEVETKIREAARKIYEHEVQIIKMIFEKGAIPGITETQLTHFVESRINECLKQLGMSKEFEVKWNPIGEWFYTAINNYTFNDFFSGIGNSYSRNWDETGFKFEEYKKAEK